MFFVAAFPDDKARIYHLATLNAVTDGRVRAPVIQVWTSFSLHCGCSSRTDPSECLHDSLKLLQIEHLQHKVPTSMLVLEDLEVNPRAGLGEEPWCLPRRWGSPIVQG